MAGKNTDVLRETDDDVVRLARSLLRKARHASLAVLDLESGAPSVSRVGLATDFDGSPILLVSALAAHTAGLEGDPRCSILVGEPGKGDPLAHPRMTLACLARKVSKNDPIHARVEWRFLSRNPKSKLYADFPDFSYYVLAPQAASLNGGFGRAYALTAEQLICGGKGLDALAAAERLAVTHMNADHPDAVRRYARCFGRVYDDLDWRMTGIDPDGFDLIAGDRVLRIEFDSPLERPDDMRGKLVMLAAMARRIEAEGTPGAGEANTNDETFS